MVGYRDNRVQCMKNKRRFRRIIAFLGMMIVGYIPSAVGQEYDSLNFRPMRHFVHGLGVEVRPEYIFPTHPFLRGENPEMKLIRGAFSTHVKYTLRYRPGSMAEHIYGGVYQGIGFGRYSFGEPEQIGDPVVFYLFQGARIARFCPWLSFNYEWNFGLSTGWKPYDAEYNEFNKMVGSKTNAYINTNFYLHWKLTPRLSLTSGVTLAHFSNGNTSFPNAGVNTIGAKVGLEYNFYRKEDLLADTDWDRASIPAFHPHVSYDFVFFGSWRRKGVYVYDGQVPSPEAYPVFGINFNPMYNLNYKFRLGLSLDGVYDGSANIYVKDEMVSGNLEKSDIIRPALGKQFSLGVSGRIEYVMPFFTVGVGMGTNLVGQGDFKSFYQVLILKIAMSRDTFLHVGYNLQQFREPNFLMLGVGFRFNNKS